MSKCNIVDVKIKQFQDEWKLKFKNMPFDSDEFRNLVDDFDVAYDKLLHEYNPKYQPILNTWNIPSEAVSKQR